MIAAWRAVNGPSRLRKHGIGLDDWIPYHFIVSGTVVHQKFISSELSATTESDGDLIITGLTYAVQNAPGAASEGFGSPTPAGSPLHIDVAEERGGRRLSDRPVSVGSLFGHDGRQFLLPAPLVLRAATRVRIALSLPIDATERHWFGFHGLKRFLHSPDLPFDLYPHPGMMSLHRIYGQFARAEPFVYSLWVGHDPEGNDTAATFYSAKDKFGPVSTETPTVTISEADFCVFHINAQFFDSSFNPALLGTIPSKTGITNIAMNHLVRLVLDEGRTRLDDRPIPLRNISGHGPRWTKLAQPLVIRRGHSISAIVTPQAASANTADGRWAGHIDLIGVRVWSHA